MLTDTKKQIVLKIPADAEEKSLAEYYQYLDKLNLKQDQNVTIDCSALKNVCSRHIMILWQVFERCKKVGAAVKMTSIGPGLVQTLKLLDIYELMAEGHDPVAFGKSESILVEGTAPESFSLRFKPSREDIKRALLKFQRFLESWHIVDLLAFELTMVFYEVVTNIRLHGNLENTNEIEFQATIKKNKLAMQFSDSGMAYDPTKTGDNYNPAKAIKSGQRNGLGLILIKRMTDKQIYTRVDDKINVLKIEKVIYSKDSANVKSADLK